MSSHPAHAVLDSRLRRPADRDGATRPLRSAVLLTSKSMIVARPDP
jgi:hypothetical protein